MCHIPLSAIEQMRFERGVQHLHQLGPRAVGELLLALTGQVGGRSALAALLAEYEMKLSPKLLRSVGAERFPNRAPRIVPRSAVERRAAT